MQGFLPVMLKNVLKYLYARIFYDYGTVAKNMMETVTIGQHMRLYTAKSKYKKILEKR